MRRFGLLLSLVFLTCFLASCGESVTTASQVPLPTATPRPTPTSTKSKDTVTPITKLTTEQKNQVGAILNGNIQHYQDLLAQGKSILGTTQYVDASAGLVAMNDPNSNASKFSVWRQTSKAETDLSYIDAFKQADAFYNADNEPDAISTWRDDMSNVQSDLIPWINVAVDWQISGKTTHDLTVAELQFDQDIKQVQTDVTATLSAS